MTTENQAPEGAEPAAWLVTWKGEKHEYVHAHASELPAVDQARIMGGKCEPLYRAAPAPQAAPAWQPIETAPRGSGEDGPHDVRDPAYIEPPTLLLWTQEGPRVGYYDWYYHPGYGRGADPHESPWRCAEGGQAYGPTHWMQPPDPPQCCGCPEAVKLNDAQIVASLRAQFKEKTNG